MQRPIFLRRAVKEGRDESGIIEEADSKIPSVDLAHEHWAKFGSDLFVDVDEREHIVPNQYGRGGMLETNWSVQFGESEGIYEIAELAGKREERDRLGSGQRAEQTIAPESTCAIVESGGVVALFEELR